MKVSVSLPGDDVRFLDEYAKDRGLRLPGPPRCTGRFACCARPSCAAAYEHAWDQWTVDGDAEAWESALADGLPRVARS